MKADLQKLFTEHFVRSQHRVYAYIVTLSPNRDDADEAFQETCLVLWDKWAEFDPSRDFVRWACGIAHNVVRNFKRAKRRSGITINDELLEDMAALRLDADSQSEARSRALSACLKKLPQSQLALIEQSYLRGRRIGQAAEQLMITPASLYLRLQRIRRRLFECVTRTLDAEGAA